MTSVHNPPTGATDGLDLWTEEAKRLAAESAADNGSDWATMPTWLLRHQWLLKLDSRVTVLLLLMSTVVTPSGEMVISERELASRLMWRFDVTQRMLKLAEDHHLVTRVFMTALPTELTWRLDWVYQAWLGVAGGRGRG